MRLSLRDRHSISPAASQADIIGLEIHYARALLSCGHGGNGLDHSNSFLRQIDLVADLYSRRSSGIFSLCGRDSIRHPDHISGDAEASLRRHEEEQEA